MKAQLVLASLILAPTLAFAQPQDGPPPPPVPSQHSHQGPKDHQGPRDHEGPGDREGHDRGFGMMMLPPGMWWKNPRIAADLGLTSDQQKKMEDIFIQSRSQLIQLHANLEQAELLLEPILDANPVDTPRALSQIGKIADARAELEKSNAKMLLSLRSTLTPEQWTKLQSGHDHHGPMGEGPGGPAHKHGAGGPPPPPAAAPGFE